MLNLYPLKLEPQIKEVVWGGRWLADVLGRAGEPEARLGESWEAYSGSKIINGEWQGRKLGDLFDQYGAELAGEKAAGYPKFPLLVKFIDAHQNLSVQVHPDNLLAQQLEQQPFGKTEFWYIIQAEPAARIYYGFNDTSLDKNQLQEALTQRNLVQYLQHSPVQAGDVVYIPAGTIHALTEGIVVYELQQDSDITYRLYDWGRTDRPIHIEKGLQALNLAYRNLQITHPTPQPASGYRQTDLLSNQYFAAAVYSIEKEATFPAQPASFSLLTVLDGKGNLLSNTTSFETLTLHKGDTVLLPARLDYRLASTGAASLEVMAGWLV